MTLAIAPRAADCSAAISAGPAILHSISESGSNLAIWERGEAHDWSALLKGSPRDIRLDAVRADPAPLLPAVLAEHGFGANHLHRALADDVAVLADLFKSVMAIDAFDLRLEVVTTDSCRKFHADYVAARLITTYVGPGTQWLDNDDAARLREGGEPRRINQLAPGDVGIFKGRLATERPAIHRSPPIALSNGPRLLLVLNQADRP